MRRILIWVAAGLESVAAVVLLVSAWQMPGAAEVEDAVGRVEAVSLKAGKQVRGLSGQVGRVRKRQPELATLARRLESQMQSVSADVKSRSLNADGLTTVSDALGQVAQGLDGLSKTLAPAGVAEIGKGLSGTADYLEVNVLPAAEKAATALDKAGAGLEADAGKLKAAFDKTPLEVKSLRAMVQSLKRFEEGFGQMAKLTKLESLEAMREGFKGLETSLESGAEQVERLSKYTYPKVEIKGLRVEVEEKDFWPDGKTIAAGMRKGAKGCVAAGKEMDTIGKELPKLRKSLQQSHAVVKATRQAISTALEQQDKLEPLLKRLPQHLALLAEELPRMTKELAKVLRETSRLAEVAKALRQAEKSMTQASANWPELRLGLEKSATLLRATRKQMQSALVHRDEYEQTLLQTVELTTMFAKSLPLMLEEVDTGLEQQQVSLDELGDSIDKVTESLPVMAESASRLLTTTRYLLGLFAAALALHAVILLGGTRGRPVVA